MQGETDYFKATNMDGNFKLTEVARCAVGISSNTTLILYKGESTDPESDYEYNVLEIISISDGRNHSQQILVDDSDIMSIADTFKDATMKV